LADIFDEVEHDLRAERARRAFARYGAVFGVVALLLVAGVAGWQGWRWWQTRSAAATATAYFAAGEGDAAAQAAAFSALAPNAPPGYAALARLRAAGLAAAAGDAAAARAHWDALARDTGAPALYRDLATVLAAMAALDSDPAGADPAGVAARLAPLTEGPWRAAVQEARALAALAAGDRAAAASGFAALANDAATPAAMRLRAERLRGEGG